MKHVVIRDDDICYFTQPEMLEKLYRPLIDAGKSVGLSVIPSIGGGQPAGPLNGTFWDRYRLDYSPCLPPEYREQKELFPLTPDCEIVRYLRGIPEYEILQHGYNHTAIDGVREGMLTDVVLIEEKIDSSTNIMVDCFDKPSDFFVVPWDDVSSESLKTLKHYFKGASLHRVGQRHVSWQQKINAASRRFLGPNSRRPYFWDGQFLLMEYPGPILSMFNDYQSMKNQVIEWLANHDILVLVSHYWEFFWDWDTPNQEFLSVWYDIVNYLLDQEDIEIVSFSNMYDKLSQ